jgi:hypothetical protein
MLNHKKILIIFLFAILLISPLVTFSIGGCRELEVPIPGLTSTCLPALPDYIVAIFNFSLMIVGIVVFGALLYGGFRWLTSAGNPAALSDAKDQIFSALLGLIILFSAWLILNTINPELVILGQPTKTTIICDVANPCPAQTCVGGKCSYEPERPCSNPATDCSALVCIYDCPSGPPCPAPGQKGVCGVSTTQGWGCSAHKTQATCDPPADPNCAWCFMCSGTKVNSYQRDICLNAGMTCMYGGTCAIGCGGANCTSDANCTDPAKPSCINCVCQ